MNSTDTKLHLTKKPWVLFYMFIVGALLAGACVYILSKSVGDPSWGRTSGKVVNNIPTGVKSFAPVVEYKVDYASFQITSKVSSSPAVHIGATRKVSYDKDNPRNAIVLPSTSEEIMLKATVIVCVAISLVSLGRLGQIFFKSA